jgi:metallo-beta-lactamase class B
VTFYITPGHTEGTISTIFPARRQPRHVVAEWGGTLFNFGPIRPRLQAYAASAERFKQLAAKAGADVILSNHTVYDGSKTKLPAVLGAQPGQPHPYVVGPQVVQRYLTTVGSAAASAGALRLADETEERDRLERHPNAQPKHPGIDPCRRHASERARIHPHRERDVRVRQRLIRHV